jgi:fibronectin type 3 domain-containing protein
MMWTFFRSRPARRPRRSYTFRRGRLTLLELEPRDVPATDVLTYHNDLASTGVNLTETALTRTNVNPSTFGKVFSYQVDGQFYAQPLVKTNITITVGPNAGTHDVVFVATQHDSLYAIDAGSLNGVNSPTTAGQLLWQRSFLDTTNPNDHLPNATSVTSVPQPDVNTSDITVEIGITGTPVIDPATNTLYLIVKTKETVGGVAHYVQRLHAINIADGTDRVASALIGDTSNGNTNNTPIYVYGSGDGHVTDPYNGTGRQVVQFNALRENQRPALTLINGVVYAGWASHGDNGPYHGWMVGWDKNTLALKGVLNTTPNGGLGGIWMAGGALSFDGTYFYFETGNGTFDGNNGTGTSSNPTAPAPGPITGLNAQGFPVNGDYGDSFVKVGLDPTTTPTSQNINGWGLKVVDYFTPFNQNYLNSRDLDVGSSACVVVPDAYGSAAHPHLLIGSGKEGVIYLIDRDNMGKYGLVNNIVQNTANQLSGSLDTAAIYSGRVYYVEGYGGTAKTFTFPLGSGMFSTTPETRSTDSFAFAGSTPSVSANGNTNGIVWDVDRGTNQLRAYSTDSYATELYTSDQASGGRDALGSAVKFQVPTVANGHVYLGAGTGNPNNFLVVYGLITPPSAAPAAPSNLQAAAVSGTQINLTWTDNDVTPNRADGYTIEQSTDNVTFTPVATAGYGATTYSVGGLALATPYYFRVKAFNAVGASGYTNVASATTTNQAPSLNFSAGFTSANTAGVLTLNGGAALSGTRLRLTDGAGNEARSAFSTAKQTVTRFTTTFTFQITNANADGFTFTIQGVSPTAVGGGGGSLGYQGIGSSLAVKFDIYDNAGEGINSTGVYTNGAAPNVPATTINPPIDLHSGHVMTATIAYDTANLYLSITDTTTNQTFTTTFTNINIPSLVGGQTAYVGFTAATGGAAATQDILGWTYTPIVPPGVPQNVAAAVTGYTAGSTNAVPLGAHVTWAAVTGANGYKVERQLAGGTWAQVGTAPAGATSFDDTGLATQATYSYRVRAYNDAGDGVYSAVATVTTPALAPTPTNGQAVAVSTNSITISWTDNANNEDGFQIFRSVNAGAFTLLTSLPANTAAAPSTVSYTDPTVTPGTRYDYHVQAFNLAGYSDFAGITTATRTLAPTGLTPSAVPAQVTLTWTAPAGAYAFNVYRGTTPGGEGATPYATNVPANSFTDTAVTNGNVYYYTVTALNAVGLESAATAEVSAAPPVPVTVQTVAVNDGAAQRSRVTDVVVTFSGKVTLPADPTAAFRLTRVGPGAPAGDVTLGVDLSGSTATQTVAKLTFAGPLTEFGSLSDGNYTLTVFGSQVIGANGFALDGDNNGTAGGDNVSTLFRLFGDTDGNRTVDALDLSQLRTAYGQSLPSPDYRAYLDFAGDGTVDALDLYRFRSRYGTVLNP